jgi:hypothetical protein
MIDQVSTQMAELSQPVKIWVNWMMFIFLAGILFSKQHREARWAVASFIGTMVLAMGVFLIWHNIHLFSLAHLVIWPPLLIYLLRNWQAKEEDKYRKWGPFKIWLTLLIATILISLPFDARDLILVIIGSK